MPVFVDRSKGLSEHTEILTLLEHPAALIDAQGRFLACNQVFAKRLKSKAARFLATDLQEHLDHSDQLDLQEFLNQYSANPTGPVQSLSVRLTVKSENLRVSIKRLPSQGDLVGFLCQSVSRDSTESLRLHYLMNHLDQGIWDYNVTTKEFVVSSKWRHLRGIGNDVDVNDPNKCWQDSIHPDDRAALISLFEGQQSGEHQRIDIQYRHWHTDGHWIWILCRARVMELDKHGKPLRIVGTDVDISQKRQTDYDLRQTARKLQMAIDTAGLGIWEFDGETQKVLWDDRTLEMFGLVGDANERSDDLWGTYLHPEDREAAMAHAEYCVKNNVDYRTDYRIIRPDGEVRHIRSLSRNTADVDEAPKLVGICLDVTDDYCRAEQLEKARAQLEYDSRHDALTGLANRRLLEEQRAALFAEIEQDQRYAVLHLDVDYFKQINDTLGHDAGDAVLVHIAHIIQNVAGPKAICCRIGGDEFVVLFKTAPSTKELREICSKIISSTNQPYIYQGHSCTFGISIGCAFGKAHSSARTEIFTQADTALYAAKQAGRGCYKIFTPATNALVKAEANARQELIDAISDKEFICHYQPQFCPRTYQLIGAEALVRWNNPEKGVLQTPAFMPLAASLGVSAQVDACVFDYVIERQTNWSNKGIEFPPISVNISKERLESPELTIDLQNKLKPHHKIIFELLETAFLDSPSPEQLMAIKVLRTHQIGIDLDDFGSGHASIAAMQAVQPDRIKIDRRLVFPILTEPKQIETLQLLTQMARLEDIGVVIAGIETLHHLNVIKDLDCDVLQGFALARPMPVKKFETLLNSKQ
ncbi:MAG: EAL domain-containing protein [Paracoccaceae bacterium]